MKIRILRNLRNGEVDHVTYLRGVTNKRILYIALYFTIPVFFLVNLLLIKAGQNFTGYRNMLFYTNNIDLLTPLIVFVVIYILIIVCLPKITVVIPNGKLYIIVAILLFLAIGPQIVLLRIPETNPDFTRYYQYADNLKDNGLIYYLGGWGTEFYTHVDMPMGSFPFGIIFSLFGSERFYIQLFMCLTLFLTSFIIFLFGSQMLNCKIGFISSIIFLSFPFILSQVPLLLVDIVSTFYITAFAYVLYKYLDKEHTYFYLITSIVVLFMAFFSKILSPFFIVPIIIGIILAKVLDPPSDYVKFYRSLKQFLLLSSSIILLYVYILRDFYKVYVIDMMYDFTGISYVVFETMLVAIIVASVALIVASKKLFLHNYTRTIISMVYKYKFHILMLMYALLIFAFMLDHGKYFFYLRLLPSAVGILPSILLFSSLVFIVKNGDFARMIPILLWVFIPIFLLPHVMYKYLIPAYPPIALLCGYVIFNLRDNYLKNFLSLTIVISGLIIALFVFYPMSMTHSQINVKDFVEDMENLNIKNFDMVYIPSYETWLVESRIHMFELFMPMWIKYYGNPNMVPDIITVHNKSEYNSYLRSIDQSTKEYLIIVSDQSSIDGSVLLPEILQNYSIYNIKNKGYHAAYWTSTRQIVILERKKGSLVIEDHGILDDAVHLTSLRYVSDHLNEFKPPININLEFSEGSYNRFIIYDFYDGRFHKSDKIYQIKENDTQSTYTITREPDRLILHIHELRKQPLNLKKIEISNETEIMAEWTSPA